MTTPPEISVVIPIYNEAAILETAVRGLVSRLSSRGWPFELILSENGSTDDTAQIAAALARELPNVRALHDRAPNYGRALRVGILAARGDIVVCDEIDLGDLDFYARALTALQHGADLVVGSKRHPESLDGRPWLRRQGTAVMSALLQVALDFKGTDTHGLKAFKREALLPVLERCVVEHHLLASELVIRASRMGLVVEEIPLRLREIRPPSVGLLRRVPHVLTDLARLTYVIRFRK